MRIKYLELYNYQRLKNKGITRIKLTFTEIIQIIIGKNGGGKSSLMREISPLPPDNGDYLKNGVKHVILEHKGQEYELMSVTGSPSRHSFKCNTVELNESKNLSAQKELCEVHFGYTNEIHELMLGLVNGVSFTTMSPAKRREWMMALYPNDLTYVNNLHDIFKTRLRDAKGGIRTSSTHLSGLYDQRGNGMSVDDMQRQIDHLQTRRDRIARLVSEAVSTEDHQRNIDVAFSEIKRITDANCHKPIALSREYRNRDEIVERINEVTAELQKLDYAKSTHTKELTELANNDAFKQAASVEDKERLEQQLEQLKQQIRQDSDTWALSANHFADLPLWQKLMEMDEQNQRNLVSLGEGLLEALSAMREMPDEEVTLRQYDSVTKLRYTLTPQIDKLVDDLNRATHRLKHLESADRTECPSCHHRWVPGLAPEQIPELKQRIEQMQQELDGLNGRMAKCNSYLQTYSIWYDTTTAYMRFMSNHPELTALHEWFIEQKLLYVGGQAFSATLPGMLNALPIKHRLVNMRIELDQLTNRLKLFDADALEWYKRRYQEHEDALNLVIENQRIVRQTLQTLQGDLSTVDTANQMVDALACQRKTVNEQVGLLAEQVITRTANTEHHQLGEEQRALTTQLYDSRSLEGSIASTEQHIQEMKETEEVLKLLVKATSPTEGIVAEQLSEFIACFIGNMNSEIDEVWHDVLQIRPCNIEDGALTYKFPLLSGEFDCETADIAESSTGEAQIINWVFRLVVMEYLGFNEFPLYGDEIGANFDERHRPKLMEFLKKCASSGKYSQIFLISHYIAQHGVFTHAEVCALSTDGVALPERYNDHVEIK